MDIHKPKPWRGVSEFLKEIGTIVVGVLIALGGEQLVENLHWRHRVEETRAQLDQELGGDATASVGWLTNARCLDGQLAALRRAVQSARESGVFHAPAQTYTPTLTVFSSDAWLNARSLQVSDHMSPELVKRYSTAFFFPTELAPNITSLHSMAGELEPLGRDLDRVSPGEAAEWAARIGRLQELQSRSELAMINIVFWADRFHGPIRLDGAQEFAARRRAVQGDCVADPGQLLAVLRDRSLKSRQKFEKLGLAQPGGM